MPSTHWLRFVENIFLYFVVIILRPERLQQLVEAAPPIAFEMLAADDFLPECVTPETSGQNLADMPPTSYPRADIEEQAYVHVVGVVERQWRQRIRYVRIHKGIG